MKGFDIHLRSLAAKLLAIYVPMVCISVLTAFSILELQYYRSERAALVDNLNRLVALQGPALSAAAWEYDTAQIAGLLAEMQQQPQLLGAAVFDDSGALLGEVGEIDAQPISPDLRSTAQLVFTVGDISENVGRLVVDFHTGEIWKSMRWHLWINALVLLVMAATLTGVTLLAERMVIGRPIQRLLQSIERMKADGVLELVDWDSADELGRVVDAYNEMQIGRRLAEEEARNRMAELAHMSRRATVGEMSASIAHEINQPLAAIVANANAGQRWLEKAPPDLEETSAALKRIVADGHRLGDVISTVRGMYRKGSDERVSCNINELVEEVVVLAQHELVRHSVSVRTSLAQGLPPVRVDRVQMQQVILNLGMNALEAMSLVADRPRILDIRTEADSDGKVVLAIADTGPGIAPEYSDRIFQPFFTTKSEGMGMGLSICSTIVEAHGGQLTAMPGKDYGSIFQITLPGNGSASK